LHAVARPALVSYSHNALSRRIGAASRLCCAWAWRRLAVAARVPRCTSTCAHRRRDTPRSRGRARRGRCCSWAWRCLAQAARVLPRHLPWGRTAAGWCRRSGAAVGSAAAKRPLGGAIRSAGSSWAWGGLDPGFVVEGIQVRTRGSDDDCLRVDLMSERGTPLDAQLARVAVYVDGVLREATGSRRRALLRVAHQTGSVQAAPERTPAEAKRQ